MKKFIFACILFLALARPAASEQGRWIRLEKDAKLDAHLTKVALPSIKYRGDFAASTLLAGRVAGVPDSHLAKYLGKAGELYWLRGRYSDAVTVYVPEGSRSRSCERTLLLWRCNSENLLHLFYTLTWGTWQVP